MTYRNLCTALATVFLASGAHAQSTFYLGGGIGYADASSQTKGFDQTSEGSHPTLSVIAGVRRATSGALFYGAELDFETSIGADLDFNGTSCTDGAAAPYFCEPEATIRLRGILGTSLGPVEVFGALGYAVMTGDAAFELAGTTDTSTVGGLTYGIGAQRALGPGTLRFEIMHDNLSNTIAEADGRFEPDWEATSARLSYLWSF